MRKSPGFIVTGSVVWFSGKKGYGFICGDDDNDYFVHRSDVRGNSEQLARDVGVEFNVVRATKGLRAVNVRIKNA